MGSVLVNVESSGQTVGMIQGRRKLDARTRPDLQQIVAGELDRQLESLAHRSAAMNARAGNLLVAAGVGAGLLSTQQSSILAAASVGLLVASAVIALFAMNPVKGEGIPIDKFEAEAWGDTSAEATRRLNSWKSKYLNSSEDGLLAKRRLVIHAAWALVGALALAALNLIPSNGAW